MNTETQVVAKHLRAARATFYDVVKSIRTEIDAAKAATQSGDCEALYHALNRIDELQETCNAIQADFDYMAGAVACEVNELDTACRAVADEKSPKAA